MRAVDHYRACAERGMTIPETARLHGVTPRAVRFANVRHNLGFDLVRNRRDLAPVREKLAALVAEGKNRREIAFILKAPIASVKNWSRRWGLRNPNWRGGAVPLMPILEPHLTEQEAADLKFLRSKGYTYRDALKAIHRADLLEGLK